MNWTALRIGGGLAILVTLGLIDWLRNGQQGQRWREYLFLAATTAGAVCYGVLNDQIACGISWEYFYYGKGLDQLLGSGVPPPMMALRWQVAILAVAATWWAGLLIGAVLLVANHPKLPLPQLRIAQILWKLPAIVTLCLVGATVIGIVGWQGGLARFSADVNHLVEIDVWHPRHFMAVWGINIGGYAGAMLGMAAGALSILHHRLRLRQACTSRGASGDRSSGLFTRTPLK